MFIEYLHSDKYKLDNQKVHQILTEITNGTYASHCIKDYRKNQDGRGEWMKFFPIVMGMEKGNRE